MRLKKPRLGLALALGAVLTLAAVAALGWWHYRPLYQEAANAREQLLQAQDTLQQQRLDATEDELVATRSQLEAAEQEFRSCQSALRHDPLVRLAEHLPWLGPQASTAEDVLAMGRDASDIGLAGVAVAEDYRAVRETSAGNTSEKTMTLLDTVRPNMQKVSAGLDALLAVRQSIGGGGLVSPLQHVVSQVDEHSGEIADLVKTYDQAAAFFPDFLGFQGPRTYLVLAQNNAELLPTGGLISVYGVVTLNQGHVQDMSFDDAVAFNDRWQAMHEYVEPPAPLKEYLLKDWSWGLDLANWSPDFPTAAQQAQFFYEKGGGGPVDGVIGINVTTLQQLLDVTGPVDVSEYGVTVDQSNVLDTTEALTRTPLEPGSDRKAFAAFLAEEMLHRLMSLPSSQWSPLLDAVQKLRDSKTALFYSFNPTLQSLAHDMGLDGALQDPPGDYLMPVEASVNSTKLNIAIDKRMQVQVALDELGDAHSTVTFDYQNHVAAWEQGRDPTLVYRLMLQGLYGGYLRLYTNGSSRLVDVAVDGTSAGAQEVSQEDGKSVFGRFFSLPKDAQRQVAFQYVTPAVADLSGKTSQYRLFIQKQPGTGDIPLSLSLSLPEGAKPLSLQLDGKPVSGDGLEVQTDLSRDREIVLTYQTAG
ncbi:MAG: DUF4012 domain-containing protein [Dehalococcoidia bacterium]